MEIDTNKVDEEAVKKALEVDSDTELEEVDTPTEEKEIKNGESLLRVERAKRILSYYKNSRRKYDKDWLSRNLFFRGYQFAQANQRTGAVTMTHSKIPVNLTWAFARSIRNQVTSFKPKWEVFPDFKGKKAKSNERFVGKLLNSILKKNN